MLMLPDVALMVLGSFAPMFTRPVWEHVQVLVTGAILCRGPHTVAGVLRTPLCQDRCRLPQGEFLAYSGGDQEENDDNLP